VAKPRVSLCLIAKDEEAVIGRCLSSVKGAVDEIVVVDTGSTDRTVAIAQSFHARIGHFTWVSDFAAARNAALDLATGDWILSIDCDEWLLASSVTAIRRLVAQPAPWPSTYGAKIWTVSDKEGLPIWTSLYRMSLFPRSPELRWIRPIHEQIEYLTKPNGQRYVTVDDFVILHDGYLKATWEAKQKEQRNFVLLQAECDAKPDEPFVWMNLATQYSYADRHAEALDAAERCIALARTQKAPGTDISALAHVWMAQAFTVATSACLALGQWDRGVKIAGEGIRAHPGYPDIHTNLALCYLNMGRYNSALGEFEMALRLQKQPHAYPSDPSRWRALRGMAQAYIGLGEHVRAIECYWAALKDAPNHLGLITEAGIPLAAIGETEEAARYWRLVLAKNPSDRFAAKLLNQGLAQVRQLQEKVNDAS